MGFGSLRFAGSRMSGSRPVSGSIAAALGAATFLGVLLTDQLAFLQTNGLAIAAGVTLYVGASNLVPELQAKRGVAIPTSFLFGCGLYLAARSLAR